VATAERRSLRQRTPALLREPEFRRYWSAQTISLFGDQISSIALPLSAVLVLRAGASQMGYLTALIWLPSLLFGVHAGAWVDRRGRRRATMLAADLGRCALLTSIPVAYAFGALSLAQLYAVAFGAGILSVLFNVCDGSLFVALVPSDRYVDGNSLIQGSRALSFVGGPSIGGLLVQLLRAPFAIAADAFSFLGSALLLHRTHVAEPPPAGDAGLGALSAGGKFIASSPVIRPLLLATATVNLFTFGFAALFMLYAVRRLHVTPGLLGVVLGAGAIGGLIGAWLTKRLADRISVGRACTLGCLLFTAPLLLIPLAGGPRPVVLAMLFCAEFTSGMGVMVLDITIASIFAVVIPDKLRSRVMGTYQAVNFGTRPVGALAAGALGGLLGVRATLWIAAAGAILGFLWLLPGAVRRFSI
jgi:MFS family permease